MRIFRFTLDFGTGAVSCIQNSASRAHPASLLDRAPKSIPGGLGLAKTLGKGGFLLPGKPEGAGAEGSRASCGVWARLPGLG